MIDDCEVICIITSDTLHKKAADIVRQCGTRDTVTVAKEMGIHLYYRDNSVAIYCRLSKDDLSLGESSSITTQKIILKKYAHMKNWEIHEFYVDDGWSGTNFETFGL